MEQNQINLLFMLIINLYMHKLLYILRSHIVSLFYLNLFIIFLLSFLLCLSIGLFINMLRLANFFLQPVTLINISQLGYEFLDPC